MIEVIKRYYKKILKWWIIFLVIMMFVHALSVDESIGVTAQDYINFGVFLIAGIIPYILLAKWQSKIEKKEEERFALEIKRAEETIINESSKKAQFYAKKYPLIFQLEDGSFNEKSCTAMMAFIQHKKPSMGLPRELVEDVLGEPDDTKEHVTKRSTKIDYYYGKKVSARGKVTYRLKIDFDNDVIEGWKEY
jgi:hypothetical protein